MVQAWIALTRGVSATIGECELSFLERQPIDVALARAQHDQYCRALAGLGVDIVALEADDSHPDAVFVEDAAVVVPELAVIGRPGVASRQGEVVSVSLLLAQHRPTIHIEAPACLDGGDVLRVGRTVYVGQTRRTNAAGIEQLSNALAPHGYDVRPVRVDGCLHLRTGCSFVTDEVALVNPRWVDRSNLVHTHLIEVADDEPFGANTLRVGERLLCSTAHPRTRERLEPLGLEIADVDVSELHKAEAGLTCMSIVFESDPLTPSPSRGRRA